MNIILFFIAAAAIWIIWQVTRKIRLNHLLKRPFPDEWEQITGKYLIPYNSLPEKLQSELKRLIVEFLHTKTFEGCNGVEITDEIRVAVAAQACLLLLNHEVGCYPKLKTILIYPSAYRPSGDGLFHREDKSSVRLGESWNSGVVVLAWDSVRGGALNFDDGKNVTLHEFAHQLDQEDGRGDGAPILESRSAYITWAEVLGGEYSQLREKAQRGKRSLMDKYGATNPAEFFAVATETFFEKPEQLERRHPELFKELVSYYQLDPRDF